MGIRSDECSVYESFTQMISFKLGRYEVNLPWKENHPQLPDNYDLSLRRLTGLWKRLSREPALLDEYDSVIRNQVAAGIVES